MEPYTSHQRHPGHNAVYVLTILRMKGMRKSARRVCFLFCSVFACSDGGNTVPHQSVQTALGSLSEIRVLKEIRVNGEEVSAAPYQRLLLLRFQGEWEIPYLSAGGREDYYVLIDSSLDSSSRHLPFFVGAFDSARRLTDQLDWKMHGAMTVRYGKTIFSGTVELSAPEVVLLYLIPAEYHTLFLQENGRSMALTR